MENTEWVKVEDLPEKINRSASWIYKRIQSLKIETKKRDVKKGNNRFYKVKLIKASDVDVLIENARFPIPEGYISVVDGAKKLNMSVTTAYTRLQRAGIKTVSISNGSVKKNIIKKSDLAIVAKKPPRKQSTVKKATEKQLKVNKPKGRKLTKYEQMISGRFYVAVLEDGNYRVKHCNLTFDKAHEKLFEYDMKGIKAIAKNHIKDGKVWKL